MVRQTLLFRGVMMTAATALILTLAQPVPAAGTFRWTDSEGNVFYGDSPPDDAVTVDAGETDECETDDCVAEREQAAEEAGQRYQEVQDSLDKIDQQRAEERKQQAEIEKARQQAPPPTVNRTIIYAPDAWGGYYGPNGGWRRHYPEHYSHPARRNR